MTLCMWPHSLFHCNFSSFLHCIVNIGLVVLSKIGHQSDLFLRGVLLITVGFKLFRSKYQAQSEIVMDEFEALVCKSAQLANMAAWWGAHSLENHNLPSFPFWYNFDCPAGACRWKCVHMVHAVVCAHGACCGVLRPACSPTLSPL